STQCVEDATLIRRLPRNCAAHGGANPRRIRAIVGKPFRERSDQLAIGARPKNLEARHPTFVEAFPIVFDSSLLRCIAHGQVLVYPVIYPYYHGRRMDCALFTKP